MLTMQSERLGDRSNLITKIGELNQKLNSQEFY